MMWRIITKDGYRQYPYEPSQEEYLRVCGIGDIQVIDEAPVWVKEAYCKIITQQIQNIVDNQAIEFDYDDIKDVPTENFEGGVYQQEAISLLSWASNLWLLRDAYFKTLNSEQDINNSFIETLQQFNNNG